MMKTNYILQLCPVQPRDGLGLSWRHRWWDFKAGSQFSIYTWIEMSSTEEHYASEHNDGEHFDCAQNIFSIVVYVWSGVLLFLHCGIRPLPRGRSNESKNNFIGKENILQKGSSSESRNKIIAIENILQRFMGLAFSLQRQSCSLWWTASNPVLFPFFSWRRNLFAALRLWLVSSPTENRFSNFVIQVTTYQKQYFYTDSLESATEFVRAIADDIKRPFSVRFFAITEHLTLKGLLMSSAMALTNSVALSRESV